MDNSLYNTDFHGWTRQQAKLLRAGRLAQSDIGNIAEESEDVGENLRSCLKT